MLNDESVLQTDRGKVIGFGRVKVPKMPKLGFDYEIPLLSFVVIKRCEEKGYIASCIHLQVDGYGADSTGACHDMISSILFYLRENFKHVDCIDNAWDNLYELSVSNPLSGILWDKYHALQYRLAKRGVSVSDTNYDGFIYEKDIQLMRLIQHGDIVETDLVKITT